MEIKNILNYLGRLLEINGVLLLLPLIVAVGYQEFLWPFIIPVFLSLLIGHFLRKFPEKELDLGDAILLSVITLLSISLFGAIPFFMNLHGGLFEVFIDGFFESISGYTTTGLSVIDTPEIYPKSLLFLRSLAQWIGGIGIIILCFSTLAKGGVSTLHIYKSEIGSSRIRPSLTKTMREIIKIYLFYTLIGIILLLISGMDIFDAINQIFCALSTGGFIYEPIEENLISKFVIMSFMLIGAIAFPIHYTLLSGKIREFLGNIEVKTLIFVLILCIPLLTFVLVQGGMDVKEAFNHSTFNLVSALTTTGFSDMNLENIGEFGTFLLILAMIMGASVGSTSGGLKLSRVVVLIKSICWMAKKSVYSETAIIPLKIRDRIIEEREFISIGVFFFSYILILVLGAGILNFYGYDLVKSSFLSSSAIGTVGLSTITVSKLPPLVKIFLMFEMIAGRLEIFPVMVMIRYFLVDIKNNIHTRINTKI